MFPLLNILLIKLFVLQTSLFYFVFGLLFFSTTAFSKEVSPKKNICHFDEIKDPLTVGDVFKMHCEWSLYAVMSSPVRIEFPRKETKTMPMQNSLKETHPWALFVLETISVFPGRGSFKVTSYKPGSYNTRFNIVSDQGAVTVEPLSWEVKSVIPKEKKGKIKPYPPYGPWRKASFLWYWFLWGISLLSLMIFITLKIRAFIKKKNKIREVKKRLKNKKAFREFISQLNLLAREAHGTDSKKVISKLNTFFRLFLENEFFIFAIKEEPKKIIKEINKYHPFIYKQELKPVLDFFLEIEKLSAEKVSPHDMEQMLDRARELAIFFLEKRGRRQH